MEVHHKLKPLHGWREFIGEVGIILLGVLLAMGLEQMVELMHWRERVALGKEALGGDFSGIFAYSKERELESHCLSRRLAEIAAIVDKAGETGRLPPVGPIGNPANRPWSLNSWNSLVGAQTAAHFSRDDLLNFGGIASYAVLIDKINREEFDDWAQLWVIVGPGRRIGDAEIGDIRRAISEAGYHAKLMRIAAYQIKDQIKQTGLPLDADFARDWPATYAKWKADIPKSPICQPLGKPPTHYGASPMRYTLDGPVAG